MQKYFKPELTPALTLETDQKGKIWSKNFSATGTAFGCVSLNDWVVVVGTLAITWSESSWGHRRLGRAQPSGAKSQ